MKIPPQTHLIQPGSPGSKVPAREVNFYDNRVPRFVAGELERLYHCVPTTLSRFEDDGSALKASTYVVREYGQVTTLFLFRCVGRRLVVYNEQVALGRAEINRFADAVFARFPEIAHISFHAVEPPRRGVRFPVQRSVCLEQLRLDLPESTDLYLSSLAPRVRGELRRFRKQLQRDNPAFRFEVYDGDEASEEQVRHIVGLHRQRQRELGQAVEEDEKEIFALLRTIRRYGVVCLATIGPRILGGVICTRVGSTYEMLMLAHEPQFTKYRLGKLCCCFAIFHAIEQVGGQFIFGQDHQPAKLGMGGEIKTLSQADVYKSRLHMFANGMHVARLSIGATARRIRLRVASAEQGSSRIDRCISGVVRVLRRAAGLLRR